MKKLIAITVLFISPIIGIKESKSQLAIPVFDAYNNGLGFIAKAIANLSEVIQRDIMPWKEKISKVQAFFKKANKKISAVVKNMKMTRDLIAIEKDIRNLFLRCRKQIDEAESFADKWKHRWILTNLWGESVRIFEVFNLVHKEGESIMDDDGRIKVIKQALTNARRVRSAMKAAVRRTNKELFRLKRQRKDVQVFVGLFSEND